MQTGKLTKIIEENLPYRPDEKRTYIGASSIGSECMRQVWYGYNDYPSEPYTNRTIRIFETGKKLEGLVLGLLEDSGVTLTRIYWDLFDEELPYFRGHVDAMWLWTARREPRAVIEVKTAKASMFNQFKNHGLRAWSPLYYSQVQAYMGMSGVHTAYVIVMNKDNCDLWDERVDFDPMFYEELKMRAVSIHAATTPPPKVSNSPGWYICKLCKYRKECHK